MTDWNELREIQEIGQYEMRLLQYEIIKTLLMMLQILLNLLVKPYLGLV